MGVAGGVTSHVARIESSEVLKAATTDLMKIFQLEVCPMLLYSDNLTVGIVG